jgi:hypothetical protein
MATTAITNATTGSTTTPATTAVTTAVTTGSTTTPVTTGSTLDPVTAAINKLSKTAIANLWEEKVTNAPWYAKLFGLISYAWNRSTAAAADKQFGPTIEIFNKASAELVKAVAERRFTPQEAVQLNLPALQFTDANNQTAYAQLNLNADQKLQEFYDIFKKRITQLNINENSADFGIYAGAAQKIIDDLSKSQELAAKLQNPATLGTKIETTKQGFNGKIFDDMTKAYADQAIGNITIDSFKQKAALIKGFFNAIDNVDIEAKMRQAIKAKHDTNAFDTIRAEFSNPAADAPRLVSAKAAIQTKLTAERTQLQTELDALRGNNGWNGTVNTAYQELQTAQREMDQAYNALVLSLNAFGGINANDRNGTIQFITQFLAAGNAASTGITNVAGIQTLLQTYTTKVQAFETKRTAHAALVTRLSEIAQYQNGTTNLSGGRLFQIDANLVPNAVEAAARAENGKVANFYNELNLIVGENNKTARSQSLHRIIG